MPEQQLAPAAPGAQPLPGIGVTREVDGINYQFGADGIWRPIGPALGPGFRGFGTNSGMDRPMMPPTARDDAYLKAALGLTGAMTGGMLLPELAAAGVATEGAGLVPAATRLASTIGQIPLWGGGTLANVVGASLGGGVGRDIGHIPEALTTATTGRPNASSFPEEFGTGMEQGALAELSPKILHLGLKGSAGLAKLMGKLEPAGWQESAGTLMNSLKRHAASGIRGYILKEMGVPAPIAAGLGYLPMAANKLAQGAEAAAEAIGADSLSEMTRRGLGKLLSRLEGMAGEGAAAEGAGIGGEPPPPPPPGGGGASVSATPPPGGPAAGPTTTVWRPQPPPPPGGGAAGGAAAESGITVGARPARFAPLAGPGASSSTAVDPYVIAQQEMEAAGAVPGTVTLPDGSVHPYMRMPTSTAGPRITVQPTAATEALAAEAPANETLAEYQARTLREAARQSSPTSTLKQRAAGPAAELMQRWGLPVQGEAAAAEEAAAPIAGEREPITNTERYWRSRNEAGQYPTPSGREMDPTNTRPLSVTTPDKEDALTRAGRELAEDYNASRPQIFLRRAGEELSDAFRALRDKLSSWSPF